MPFLWWGMRKTHKYTFLKETQEHSRQENTNLHLLNKNVCMPEVWQRNAEEKKNSLGKQITYLVITFTNHMEYNHAQPLPKATTTMQIYLPTCWRSLMKIYCCRPDSVSSHWGSSSHYDLDSQNHRMLGVGKSLCGSSSPTPQLIPLTDRADNVSCNQLYLSVFILWGRRFVCKEIQLKERFIFLILYTIAASDQQL